MCLACKERFILSWSGVGLRLRAARWSQSTERNRLNQKMERMKKRPELKRQEEGLGCQGRDVVDISMSLSSFSRQKVRASTDG